MPKPDSLSASLGLGEQLGNKKWSPSKFFEEFQLQYQRAHLLEGEISKKLTKGCHWMYRQGTEEKKQKKQETIT